MQHWEDCEKFVQNLVNAPGTIGSGNKGQTGDIIVKDTGYYIEIKSTIDKDKITIKKKWLDVAERSRLKFNLALVVFFGDLTGTVYYFSNEETEYKPWSTITCTKETLPDTLITENGIWEKADLYTLTEIANEK